MITVVFQCSSPYVGYTTWVADYQKKEMTECSARQMTELGMRLFQVSGTYAILMDIKQRKYFHARQLDSCVLDEQGRRIYNNVAFVGAQKDERDSRIITDIALYELFNAERFYRELAEMIHLTDEGFYVDYEKLELFLKRFEAGVQCRTTHNQVRNLYEDIRRPSSNKMIRFVVLEATWEYFVKQAGNDFGGSVDWKLTLSDMKTYAGQAEVGLVSEAGDGRTGIKADPPKTAAADPAKIAAAEPAKTAAAEPVKTAAAEPVKTVAAEPVKTAAAEEKKETGGQQAQLKEDLFHNNPIAVNHLGIRAKIMITIGAGMIAGAALAALVCRIIF